MDTPHLCQKLFGRSDNAANATLGKASQVPDSEHWTAVR